MQGIVTNPGGFDKVIFESILDTYAGGLTIDVSGSNYSNADNVIPAGTIVSFPDAVTGLSLIIAPSTTASDFNNAAGLTTSTVPIDANPFVSACIDGTARQKALGWTDAQKAAIAPKLKKIVIV